jgi:hypothetical protein
MAPLPFCSLHTIHELQSIALVASIARLAAAFLLKKSPPHSMVTITFITAQHHEEKSRQTTQNQNKLVAAF